MSNLVHVRRPEGWPWGEAGLVDAPTPDKQKKKSRRKRSTSPLSQPSNAQPDAPVLTPPPAKRAKRAAAVGAARVVKRPNRKGKILVVVWCFVKLAHAYLCLPAFRASWVWTNASNKGCWHSVLLVLQQWKAETISCTLLVGLLSWCNQTQQLLVAAESHTML